MPYLLLLLLLAASACHSSDSTFSANFQEEALSDDWDLIPLGKDTTQNKTAFNEMSGIAVAQNVRLESPKFPIKPLQYYRVEMQVQADEKTMWALIFYNDKGEMLLADHYSSIDPSIDFQRYVFYAQSKANATQAAFWLQPAEGKSASLKAISINPAVDARAVKHWSDSVYQTIPSVVFSPPTHRFQHLDKTKKALENGEKVRVVMLGNSIINDTGNSAWEVLVEEMYPGADLEVITSVRGGTGCTYYQHQNRVDTFVVQYQPDLLMIGGISHGNDTAAIHSVIRQVRERMEPDPEIMVMSGPVGRGGDPRTNVEFTLQPSPGDFRTQLAQMTSDAEVEYFDMKSAWGEYMAHTHASYDYFLRDPVHANARGRQVLARLLATYFEPE
ncbi:MAG: SGNH/GDSL hydrolase family protein [Tunicatimonas sp.]|uniref:SGNH/GDSL hydrolase family protein n=1 Tax=Tunicatimonas sp. TaxID=1940096 RepID=UPI003C77D0A3